MTENEVGSKIVDTAVRMHMKLGPGLLETVYETILARKLQDAGLNVQRQVAIPVEYEGLSFDEGFRADLVIDRKVIVELKSVESVNNAHKKQVLTYLKLSGMKLGFVLNFGKARMKDGISRIISGSLTNSKDNFVRK